MDTPTLPDDGLVRRLKALACTAPIHDLDARKNRLEWVDAEVYLMAEIAFHVIDQVMVSMDFDRGASARHVIARTIPYVARQAPHRPHDEHQRVATWVLESLINVGAHHRSFETTYGFVGATGYQRRTWSFRLLVELADQDGQIYLRSTDEAVNVLVGALDTDVESAHEAAETKLDTLVSSGQLSDALSVAKEARWRTIQFAEQLRRKLTATKRDVRAVDWLTEVPALIEDALSHVDRRFRAENAILTNITAARDETDDPGHKRKAAELVDVVRDCMRRHTQLQARLQQAGATFRAEQDRQQFTTPTRRASVDLYGQVLQPTLELPVTQAARVCDRFFTFAAGPHTPPVPRLLDIIGMLVAPPETSDGLGAAVPNPDLVAGREPDVFSEDDLATVESLLTTQTAPRRLSDLLAHARTHDAHLAHLLALRVLHAVDPDVTSTVRQGDSMAIVAVDDGTVLMDPEFGGQDYMVFVVDFTSVLAELEMERTGTA